MLPELRLPSPEGLLSPDGPMVSGGWPGGPLGSVLHTGSSARPGSGVGAALALLLQLLVRWRVVVEVAGGCVCVCGGAPRALSSDHHSR